MSKPLTEQQAEVIMTGFRLMEFARDEFLSIDRHMIFTLLLFLYEDGYVYASYKELRRASKYSRESISRTINRLIRLEVLTREAIDDGYRYQIMMHRIVDFDVFNGIKRFKKKPDLQGRVPKQRRIKVFVRDRGMRRYCRSDKKLTIDHVNPLSKGGTDAETNLVTACSSCNSKKRARTPEQAGMILLEVPS